MPGGFRASSIYRGRGPSKFVSVAAFFGGRVLRACCTFHRGYVGPLEDSFEIGLALAAPAKGCAHTRVCMRFMHVRSRPCFRADWDGSREKRGKQ